MNNKNNKGSENIRKRKEKNEETEDFFLNNRISKQQKRTPTTKNTGAMDMSADIIDIDDTPDVAVWDKELHIKGDASDVRANTANKAKIAKTPTTINMGLRAKHTSKKDLIIDPASKKAVNQAINSGVTLTDET